MSSQVRFSHKETRKLAAEAEEAGFVYVGDDTKGHAQFVHVDSGYSLQLSETPGHGQIKRVRGIIAKATGARRGGFDRAKQRARQAALREVVKRDHETRTRLIAAAEQRRIDERWESDVRRMVEARYRELKTLDRMMRTVPGMRTGRSIL